MLSHRSLELLHNSLGWVQTPVLYLGLFWHQDSPRMQGNLTAGHHCQPLQCPCTPDQLTLHTAAKVIGIGWIKTQKKKKVRETFLSNLIQKKRKWKSIGQGTRCSDLYCFVGKAAATGAYFDKNICHHLGYTQSRHARSPGWWGAHSYQAIPSQGKLLSDVLLPTHHKNRTMLPKTCHAPAIRSFRLPAGSHHSFCVHISASRCCHCTHQCSPNNSPQRWSLKKWLQPMCLGKVSVLEMWVSQ